MTFSVTQNLMFSQRSIWGGGGGLVYAPQEYIDGIWELFLSV